MSITKFAKGEADFLKEIGEKLKTLREETIYSQNDIARFSGCGKNHISEVENGESRLTLFQLIAYCRVLHVSPNDILGYGPDELNSDEAELVRHFRRLNADQQNSVLNLLIGMK